MANYPLIFYLIYRGNSVKLFLGFLVQNEHSEILLLSFPLSTFKLPYARLGNSVLPFSVENNLDFAHG